MALAIWLKVNLRARRAVEKIIAVSVISHSSCRRWQSLPEMSILQEGHSPNLKSTTSCHYATHGQRNGVVQSTSANDPGPTNPPNVRCAPPLFPGISAAARAAPEEERASSLCSCLDSCTFFPRSIQGLSPGLTGCTVYYDGDCAGLPIDHSPPLMLKLLRKNSMSVPDISLSMSLPSTIPFLLWDSDISLSTCQLSSSTERLKGCKHPLL